MNVGYFDVRSSNFCYEEELYICWSLSSRCRSFN